MRAAAILALFALMTGAAQAQDCKLQQYGSVDMHVADENVSIPVVIGGVQKEFALNLEGAVNRISQDLVDELKLQAKPLPPKISFSGPVQFTKRVVVPELQLGDVKLKDVEFLVVPPGAKLGGMENAISVGLFGKVDIELDMAGKKLKFFSQDHCPGQVVYWTREFTQVPFEVQEFGYVRPTLQLDGHPMSVALSLNSPSSIDMGTVRQVLGLDENSPGMTVLSTNEEGTKIYQYPFKSLGTEDLKITNPALRVMGYPRGKDCSGHQRLELPDRTHLRSTETPQPVTCSGGAGLILGYSILSKLHLYFSLKEKLMYLSSAGAH